MMTEQEIAKRSADAMWANDQASKWLGVSLVEVNTGTAVLDMPVKAHHCNGHGICHGGFIFTLADSAFAFACNSRNQRTVSQHNMITYTAPAKATDTLRATAVEISLIGRNGITDVTVTNQNGDLIATFRGFSRSIKGKLFEETP